MFPLVQNKLSRVLKIYSKLNKIYKRSPNGPGQPSLAGRGRLQQGFGQTPVPPLAPRPIPFCTESLCSARTPPSSSQSNRPPKLDEQRQPSPRPHALHCSVRDALGTLHPGPRRSLLPVTRTAPPTSGSQPAPPALPAERLRVLLLVHPRIITRLDV
jgi:hypothetical protein